MDDRRRTAEPRERVRGLEAEQAAADHERRAGAACAAATIAAQSSGVAEDVHAVGVGALRRRHERVRAGAQDRAVEARARRRRRSAAVRAVGIERLDAAAGEHVERARRHTTRPGRSRSASSVAARPEQRAEPHAGRTGDAPRRRRA